MLQHGNSTGANYTPVDNFTVLATTASSKLPGLCSDRPGMPAEGGKDVQRMEQDGEGGNGVVMGWRRAVDQTWEWRMSNASWA